MTQSLSAQALWITGKEHASYKDTAVEPRSSDLQIRTLFSGISRGTEQLVFRGRVPVSEHDTMRAPFQDGSFTFPIKYGYAAVGRVETGARADEIVFVLYPHQTRFSVPDHAVFPVPAAVPPERAVLAANMETALTIMWDAQINLGDRVTVVGCGVIGALVGYLAAKIPGCEVTIIDIDAAKRTLANTFGCDFAQTHEVPKDDADVVIHASASAAGFSTAISVAGVEATIIEASWYGDQMIEVPLGGRFHQRRLQVISSQVGRIPARQSARWTYQRRLSKALCLLADPRLDALISGETPFDQLASEYNDVLSNPSTLCHRVTYG